MLNIKINIIKEMHSFDQGIYSLENLSMEGRDRISCIERNKKTSWSRGESILII